MPQNSDILHEVLTTILHAYRSPGHAFGSGHKPESWASYGDLTQKLLGLIARAGELPASVDDLDENDQGKLKATLSNELQLAEKHAEAVIHAQCKFMQAVAQAAVDAVEEVSDVLNDKDATVDSGDSDSSEDAPKAGAPVADEDAHGVPEAQDAPPAPSAPSDPSNPPAPNDDLKPIAAPPPETYTSGPEVLSEPAPHAEDAPPADAPAAESESLPQPSVDEPTEDQTISPPESSGSDGASAPAESAAESTEEPAHDGETTDSPSAPEPSEDDLAGIQPVGPGFPEPTADSPSEPAAQEDEADKRL